MITSQFTLTAALKTAKPGDTLVLSGTFADIDIRNFAFPVAVTLDCGHAAARSLTVVGCTGLHLHGLTVNYTPTVATAGSSSGVRIEQCQDVTLTGGKITGGLAVPGGQAVPQDSPVRPLNDCIIGLPCGYGVNITHSRQVSLEGVEITRWDHGIVFNFCDGGQVSDCNIHGTRRTPICGAGVTRYAITSNWLHDVQPWRYGQTPLGDHGDMLALWIAANQTFDSDSVVIANNRMEQFSGALIMGMWLQPAAGNPARWTNVDIDGNTIATPNLQSILLYAASGRVRNNRLLAVSVPGWDPKQRSTILLRAGATDLTIENNITSAPISDLSGGKNPQTGNQILGGYVTA